MTSYLPAIGSARNCTGRIIRPGRQTGPACDVVFRDGGPGVWSDSAPRRLMLTATHPKDDGVVVSR